KTKKTMHKSTKNTYPSNSKPTVKTPPHRPRQSFYFQFSCFAKPANRICDYPPLHYGVNIRPLVTEKKKMVSRSTLNSPRSKPVLVYLVTEDWYFVAHRVPMAAAAQRAGYDIHVVTHVDKHRAAIETLGFRVHAVDWRRGSIDPFAFLNSIRAVRRHYCAIGPDLVHHVALQPTIVGSLAASGLPCVRLNALTGLGFVFTSETLRARFVRPILRALLRYAFRDARAAVLVENPDDRDAVKALGAAEKRIFTIAGSGVDTDKLRPLPEPSEPVTIAFAGRLLKDKGIRTLVEAHDILARRGQPVRLLIAGEPDRA